MKSKTLLIVIIFFVAFGLFACQRDESIESTPFLTKEGVPDEYPGPATPLLQTQAPMPTYDPENYPLPEAQATMPPPSAPDFTYPEIEDGGEINWIQAQQMVLQGYVFEVAQTHDLKVYLTLKDGRTLITYEPNIDDIFKVIEVCGEICEDVVVATE